LTQRLRRINSIGKTASRDTYDRMAPSSAPCRGRRASLGDRVKCVGISLHRTPNQASLLRLVSAVLIEIDQEWKTARTYLIMENG